MHRIKLTFLCGSWRIIEFDEMPLAAEAEKTSHDVGRGDLFLSPAIPGSGPQKETPGRVAVVAGSPRRSLFTLFLAAHFFFARATISEQKRIVVTQVARSTGRQVKLTILNTSIVVLADAHNPTILHPAFLKAQKIVPAEWETSEPPVCTPAFSMAKYLGGQIVFTAEISKFQILDNGPSQDSPIPKFAEQYLSTLPHVHYTAVGVNMTGFIEDDRPAERLLTRFFKDGPWNEGSVRPESAGWKFVYPVDPGRLNLGCEAGTVQEAGKSERPCMHINGNYHLNVSPGNALSETIAAIALYSGRFEHFRNLINLIFETDE